MWPPTKVENKMKMKKRYEASRKGGKRAKNATK